MRFYDSGTGNWSAVSDDVLAIYNSIQSLYTTAVNDPLSSGQVFQGWLRVAMGSAQYGKDGVAFPPVPVSKAVKTIITIFADAVAWIIVCFEAVDQGLNLGGIIIATVAASVTVEQLCFGS